MTPEPIPVLTLWQPWASLIALGEKTIETRSWSTKYRGPLAIHAAARTPTGARIGGYFAFPAAVLGRNNTRWVLRAQGRNGGPDGLPGRPLPLGAIVATCTLVDVVEIPEPDIDFPPPPFWVRNRPYGDFTPGRYAWLLADVVPVDPPAPFKGGQGLTRKWTPALAEQSIA